MNESQLAKVIELLTSIDDRLRNLENDVHSSKNEVKQFMEGLSSSPMIGAMMGNGGSLFG